ncbi:hypothetical protein Tco_0059842 [Tanacetum coccineum]
MVDDLLSIKIRYATRTALESYTKKFENKAQEERKLYIDVVEKSVKDIIKDESTITVSLENVVLAKSSSQPQSTYELDKDLFDSHGKAYSLKRSREDKDTDEDPPAGPDQGLNSSKGTKSQSKSFGKSVQVEEPVCENADIEMPQDQGDDMGNTKDQPNVEIASKHDWFKKPKRPPTPYPDWNIDNLRQQHLVGPTFNLLKGTCKVEWNLNIISKNATELSLIILTGLFPKFCDGILTFVRRVLHDIASSLELEYLQKRTWSKLDRKRSRIMIKAIDQQLFERRLMRNLEKFVGGREYGNDFRLLEWTI